MEIFIVTAYYRDFGDTLVGVFDTLEQAEAASSKYLLDKPKVSSCNVRYAIMNEYRDWA